MDYIDVTIDGKLGRRRICQINIDFWYSREHWPEPPRIVPELLPGEEVYYSIDGGVHIVTKG